MNKANMALGLIVAALLTVGSILRPASAQSSGSTVIDTDFNFESVALAQITAFGQAATTVLSIANQNPMNILATFGRSCPVFVGPGTLLGETSCAWTKVTGEAATQGSTTSQAVDWRGAGQFEFGPGWFVGGGVGTTATSAQMSSGPSSVGRSFSAGTVLKRVDGPWFFSGSFVLSTRTDWNNWPVQLPGGGTAAMTGAVYTFGLGAMVRGAYQIPLDSVYLRPSLETGLQLTSRSALREQGQGRAVTVDPISKALLVITPMLEIGARHDIGALVLRPYLAGGATFLPDNSTNISGTVGATRFSGTAYGQSVLANVEAGLQLYQAKSWETKLEYRLSAADQYLDQLISLRGARYF
ncbi:hypothetical protein [Reyranella sp.]|uniref:hypothetical protein n=1 Tax=Reyranella sp. TaxID=1929291 RepID=UPI003D143020